MELKQCEDNILWPKGDKCPHAARVTVDGTNYCIKHASGAALRIAEEIGRLKRLDSYCKYFKTALDR